MELIEGKTLGALVRSGRAPLGGIVQVVTEVLAALDARTRWASSIATSRPLPGPNRTAWNC